MTDQSASPIPKWDRPHASLMRYYVLVSLLSGPLFFVILIPLYFRYHTMRYVFDDEGVTMRWGVLFRREISLAYGRLQDIHLTSNAVERYLGLAKVQLQTASGSAKAEMTIEGLPDCEVIRDFLYSRMRGARGVRQGSSSASGSPHRRVVADVASSPRLVEALDAVTEELAAIRSLLEQDPAVLRDRASTDHQPGE